MGLVATTLTEPSEGRAPAIAFLIDAYEGVRTGPGKGLPHAQAVADILREAGYDQCVQVVGLLHDVVEDTPRTIQDVRDGFGETVAAMVEALTEDDSIHNYAQRKRGLRAQVIGAGTTVMDIALADKIATLQHARITATRVRRRKLAHYEATLQLAVAAGRRSAVPARRGTPRTESLTPARTDPRLRPTVGDGPGDVAHGSRR
jgi:(p)ppGpp synthase/HD superfamily hydrolase